MARPHDLSNTGPAMVDPARRGNAALMGESGGMASGNDSLEVFTRFALRLWVAATALVVVSTLGLYAALGAERFPRLIQQGPISITELTLASVTIVWMSWGAALALLRRPRLRSGHGMAILGCVSVLSLYVNVLRERIIYGDILDYVRAAVDLQAGRPFHGRYLYPPLLATLCQPLVPLGPSGLANVFWLGNIAAFIVFFWLLRATLEQYGFGRNLALLVVVAFTAVNVPILRTFGYIQVNLHVMNLILAAILFFPTRRILSALALAAAVHLKASPLVLVLPFVLERDGRWLASFLAGLAGLAGLTGFFYGWEPFVSFIENARHIYAANGICFRENSLDNLVRAGTLVLNLAEPAAMTVGLVKAPLLALIILVACHNFFRAAFFARGARGQWVRNGAPALLVLMLLASPLVWEHHGVFLALPFLVIARKLDTPQAWGWYSLAYLLEFLLPTFDFFPWSFGRLLSPIVLSVLLARFGGQDDSEAFLQLRNRLDAPLAVTQGKAESQAGRS